MVSLGLTSCCKAREASGSVTYSPGHGSILAGIVAAAPTYCGISGVGGVIKAPGYGGVGVAGSVAIAPTDESIYAASVVAGAPTYGGVGAAGHVAHAPANRRKVISGSIPVTASYSSVNTIVDGGIVITSLIRTSTSYCAPIISDKVYVADDVTPAADGSAINAICYNVGAMTANHVGAGGVRFQAQGAEAVDLEIQGGAAATGESGGGDGAAHVQCCCRVRRPDAYVTGEIGATRDG